MTRNIFSLAHRLKETHETNNPKELCAILGISYVIADLPDSINGFYMENGGRQAVVVSDSLPERQRTVCAAHELGHAVLHKGMNAVFITENTNLPLGKFEREADLFATSLLLGDTFAEEYSNTQSISTDIGLPEYAIQSYASFICSQKR